jgi:hypothetical protein
VYRTNKRVAFGQLLAKKDTIRQIIAESRIELTKCQWPILASCDPRSHIATRISPMIASTAGRLPSTVKKASFNYSFNCRMASLNHIQPLRQTSLSPMHGRNQRG